MTEFITAWECIGCGRIEASRPCIGVCQDRKTEFVYARDYEKVVRSAEKTAREMKLLKGLVEQLARTKPRAGQWERCFTALQRSAAQILLALPDAEPDAPVTAADPAISPAPCPPPGRTGGAAP